MRYNVLCERIDDCTMALTRGDKTIVVSRQRPFVFIINPNILVGDCPLITYVCCGLMEKVHYIVSDVCFDDDCGSYFSEDVTRHLKNGYLNPDNKDEVEGLAKAVYKTYVNYVIDECPIDFEEESKQLLLDMFAVESFI